MDEMRAVQDYMLNEKQKLYYTWKIVDFPSLIALYSYSEETHTIQSVFRDQVDDPLDYRARHLKLRFNGRNSTYKGWLSFALSPNVRRYVDMKCSIFVLDNQNKKHFVQNFENVVMKKPEEFHIAKFIETSKLFDDKDKFLQYNQLTIGVKITGFIGSTTKRLVNRLSTPIDQLLSEIKNIYRTKVGNDIVLLVGKDKTKIRAHKLILSTRNPMFEAEISHQLKIKGGYEVTLPDMEPNVCEKMLEYIYTDDIQEIDAIAESLYEETVKYQLPALRELCGESFCRTVTVQSVVRYLLLLDRHKTKPKFFEFLLDYVVSNHKAVMATDDFKNLKKTNPALLTILKKLIASIPPSSNK